MIIKMEKMKIIKKINKKNKKMKTKKKRKKKMMKKNFLMKQRIIQDLSHMKPFLIFLYTIIIA